VRPALLVSAHGSPSPGWEDAVREFAAHVGEYPGLADTLHGAPEVAFLDGAKPAIPDAVRALLFGGASRVLVAPLFLTASTHASEDLPGLLAQPVPDHVTRRLIGEGQRPLDPAQGRRVTILDLGAIDALLAANVRRRLALRSVDPSREAVVLCAYGSPIHHERWEDLLARVRRRLMLSGFSYAAHAYVGHVVGLSPAPTSEAIARAGRMAGVRRVHVVPLLLGRGELQTKVIAKGCAEAEPADRAFRIDYVPDAVLPDGDLAAHVAVTALRELGVYPAFSGRGSLPS
jgi:sirohydrochlorin ferrochelatase